MVKDCKVCVKTKALQYKSYRELQILFIFERTWGSVIIDFIVKLFKSKDLISNINYNSIFIIVKRFTKYSKFISINESYSIKDFTDTVIQEVISNYRLPDEFIIDKGITFVLRFFITFIIKFGINNKFSTAFYFQTDEQIERFNQTVEQYFKYYINYN